jgi:hypothetical protein
VAERCGVIHRGTTRSRQEVYLSVTRLLVCVLAISRVAQADVVTDWNKVALNAIRASKTPPPIASRALAILHVSIFDAVNGLDPSYESYFVQSSVAGGVSKEAAASAAAHTVLAALFPDNASEFDALYAATLAGIRPGPKKLLGVEWGRRVAQQILAWRARDGSDASVVTPTGSGPGVWVPTPPALAPYLLPQWGNVVPFAMPSSSFFRPNGPTRLNTPAWTSDYTEVRAYGAATGSLRTLEQSDVAFFWADGPGTETPPGHWNIIAATVATQLKNNVKDNARLFALLNIALADAAICAWDAKYTYNFWRPVTAIRSGDGDGDSVTSGDRDWASFLPTPPFPDYVSGHSTFSGAAAGVLQLFFKNDRIAFDSTSDGLPGVIRHFTSFSAAADEAAVSRLYAGIHFRTANVDGLKAGFEIGRWTVGHHLRPSAVRPFETTPTAFQK